MGTRPEQCIQAPTTLSADASFYGLDTVLVQEAGGRRIPIVYSMTETERRYAQIEEALVITWAAEKCADYNLGKPIQIKTYHKHLVPLLTSKQLDSLPPHILYFRLKMDQFTYTINHVQGKELNTADTLYRIQLPTTSNGKDSEELAEIIIVMCIDYLSASKD